MTVVKHLPTQMVAAPATPPVVEAAPEADDPYAEPDRYTRKMTTRTEPPRGSDGYDGNRYNRYRYDRCGNPL